MTQLRWNKDAKRYEAWVQGVFLTVSEEEYDAVCKSLITAKAVEIPGFTTYEELPEQIRRRLSAEARQEVNEADYWVIGLDAEEDDYV